MPTTHRLARRFFSVLISIAFTILLPHPAFAQGGGLTLCQITDTVYRADGSPAQGDVVILWNAFTTAAGQPVAAGNLTVTLGANGQFSAALAPNAGATPAGSYYRVTYKLDDGSTSSEYWSVPALQTTTIGAIRSTLVPANQAAQFLTRTWADAHYMDLTDAQTVAGVKTFTNSPTIPTPQNPNDAANKAYVDANGGSGANLSSPPPIGNVTPNTGNFTTLTVQTTNGVPNPANYPQPDPCAKINAAIGALPAAGGTVDARGFLPGETCNAILQINKPVTLLFGAGNWTFNGSPGINITAPNVVIACPAAATLETSSSTLISGAAAPLIANFADAEVNNGNYHTADATQILDCSLNGNNLSTFGIFAPAVYSMKIRGVHASAFTAANILAIAGQNDLYNIVSDTSGGDGIVIGADSRISGMSQSNNNAADGWHIVSSGNALVAPTAWENKLYGLHIDGNLGGDWLTTHTYLEPKFILPASNNPGAYAYYSQHVGTTGSTRPAQFCQTIGCTTTDGSVTWINVGNANLYGLGASEFAISFENIGSPNISESNYGNNSGDWDNIFIEGTSAQPATQISLLGAKPHDSAVPSYPAHGVHLKYVTNSSVKDVQWSGGALSSQPQPDLGGMAVEDSSMLEIDDLNCLQSYASCLSFIASSDIVASKVVSFNGGASSGPASNVVSLDSGSQNILLDGVEADDNRTQPLQRGISSSASHIVVKNEKYGSIATGDSGVQTTESLAPADSLFYTIPASAGFDWTIGGSTIATISDLGLNATVSTAQDLSTTNFPVLDVRSYGVKGDGTQLNTCTGTAGSPNVACTGATFTAADIGKMVNFLGAGSSGSVLTTTVAGCSPSCPAGTVTLATNVLTTSSQLFFYGTDNLAAWCNMMNCTSAAGPNGLYTPSPGRRIFMPRGTYFFSNSIGSRNGDQIVGADQSATELLLFNSNLYQQFLYLGAYNNAGTWTLDAGGLNNGVRGILFSTPLSAGQTCINTLNYSGFTIEDNWFECGIGIQSTGSAGRIAGNTFDSNTFNPVILTSASPNNYAAGLFTIQIEGNLFFGSHYNAITLNGGNGITINDNQFWISKYNDIAISSSSNLTTSHLTITGNHFVTSINGNYNCGSQMHINIGAPLADSTITGNTFVMGHTYDIAASATLNDVVISANSFRGACRSGECSNPCSGQGSTTGQQLSAIDLESSSNSNVSITNNDFDSPGDYAVRTIGPANVIGNSCSNPFATSPPPGQNYDTGCFAYPSPSGAGSVAYNNTTNSTTAAAVVAWNGATNIRLSGNQSASASDVVVAGSGSQTFSSWNERIVNAGGATILSQMDPTTGNANFAGDLSARDIPGHEYFVSHYASIQAAINAASNNGSVLGTVIDDRTAPYTGPGFNIPDSVIVRLAATNYTINSTTTFNNGDNNVTAGIIVQPGGRLLGASTSTNHGTIVQPANGLNADLIATSTVGTGTTNPQWWHWGEIAFLRLVGNGSNQTAGDCLKVENMGEVASVHDIEFSACYNNNFEDIGYAATPSDITNITSNRAVTGSGVAFTNLSGIAVLNGISGDCNQTALIGANFNSAGTLTIHGLKAEAESTICNPQVQDPVILATTTTNSVLASIKVDGGYAFGTSQQNFAKSTGPGSIQFELENFYLNGYVNILNDTVRGQLIANTAAALKQPVFYLSNGMVFGNQAFTFLPNTFMQGNPNGTPTEMFGVGSDSSTDLAAIGNGDNTKYFTGGLKFGTFNRTQFGQSPEYQSRMGWRWTNPGYDTNTWTFIPIWATGDTSARWIGDPNQRWPEVYAADLNSTTATIGTLNVTTCNGCGSSGGSMVYPGAGIASSTGAAWGTSYSSTNPIPVADVASGYPAANLASGALGSGVTIPWSQVTSQPTIPTQGSHIVGGTMQANTTQLTGNSSDQTIYSATLPAGTFSTGQGAKCFARWTHSSTSTAVTYKWTLGSATVAYGSLTSSSQNFTSDIEIYTISSLTSQIINASPIIGGTSILAGPSNNNTGSENLANADTIKFTFNMPNTDWVKGSTFYCQTIQ